MKSTLILFSIIGLILISDINPAYAVTDSCLKMICPDDGWEYSNPDSIKVDSCFGSNTYGEWFKKSGYWIRLEHYIFNKKPIAFNELINVNDIDSTNFKDIKNSFIRLENKFGKIVFKRQHSMVIDSDFIKRPVFVVDFSKYFLVKEHLDSLEKTKDVLVAGIGWGFSYLSAPEEEYYRIESMQIYPNPALDFIEISVGANGRLPLQTDVRIFNVLGEIQTTPTPALSVQFMQLCRYINDLRRFYIITFLITYTLISQTL